MDNSSKALGYDNEKKTSVYFLFRLPFSLISVGYKSRIDSSLLGANRKVINEARAKKIEEYRDSMELIQIRKMYEMHKVVEHINLLD